MTRDTVGKISSALLQKQPESNDPIELQRKMQEDWCNQIDICIANHMDTFATDFYVVIITKRERLMPNVYRNYFCARSSCPTPDYDQTVYKFHKQDNLIEYIWTVPDKETCLHLKENALMIHPEEKELLGFIMDFADGTLFKRALELNGDEKILEYYKKGIA